MSHEQVEQLLDGVFRRVVAAESIAAVIVEPVLGEGGFVVPPAGFLPALADISRRHGIVFIADEVQTGFGRTGELFACTHFGIEPDLILTAKSLGGGMPLAAITGRAEIMDAPEPGGLGGTFGGNPASCAAALAVIEEFADGTLLARARSLGERFHRRAMRLAAAACIDRRRARRGERCRRSSSCRPIVRPALPQRKSLRNIVFVMAC